MEKNKRRINKTIWWLNIGGKLSQGCEGEDIMIWRIFTEVLNIRDGFYIDVGAFLPRAYSNTWILRKRLGFKGINIEPSKEGFKLFKRYRKNDINLWCLCGDKIGEMEYSYDREEPSLSKVGKGEMRYVDTLENICKEHNVKEIDFLDVDVEGYELKVLRGHNWKIKPKVISLEVNDCETTTLNDILKNSRAHRFVVNRGYETIGKTQRNMIYVDKKLSKFPRR